MNVCRALDVVQEALEVARETLRGAQTDVDRLEAARLALIGGAAPEPPADPKPKPPRRPASSTRAAPISGEAMATVRGVLGDGPILASDLIERTSMARSTVFLILKTLRKAGEIEHDGSRPRTWRLTGPTSTPIQPAPVRTSPRAGDYLAQSLGLGEPEVGVAVLHRIEAALGESDVALTIHGLARATSCTSGAVVAALRRLRSDGRAIELEPGEWRASTVADPVR